MKNYNPEIEYVSCSDRIYPVNITFKLYPAKTDDVSDEEYAEMIGCVDVDTEGLYSWYEDDDEFPEDRDELDRYIDRITDSWIEAVMDDEFDGILLSKEASLRVRSTLSIVASGKFNDYIKAEYDRRHES